MNFDLVRPLVAISRSRDIQQMNKTAIARKRLELREKLQWNTILKTGIGLSENDITLTYSTSPSGRFGIAWLSAFTEPKLYPKYRLKVSNFGQLMNFLAVT